MGFTKQLTNDLSKFIKKQPYFFDGLTSRKTMYSDNDDNGYESPNHYHK